MKISKAKGARADEANGWTRPSCPKKMAKRRQRLKALIKLGKTRGYLTHGEISDHLPDKLVDAETRSRHLHAQRPGRGGLRTDAGRGVADADQHRADRIHRGGGRGSRRGRLSTVDSEFRTTDPVRMYMREMGTWNCSRAKARSRSPSASRAA